MLYLHIFFSIRQQWISEIPNQTIKIFLIVLFFSVPRSALETTED